MLRFGGDIPLNKRVATSYIAMSEEDRLDRFLRGLKGEIHERVAIQQPRTLADACRMANTIDTIRYQARFSPNRFPTATTRSAGNGVIPMEVDAIRRSVLSGPEREALKRSGGCFFCRGAGHMARDCPKKKRVISAVETEAPANAEEFEEGKEQAQ